MSNMKIYQGDLIEKEANLIYGSHMQEHTPYNAIVAYHTVVGATAGQKQSRSMDGIILRLAAVYRVLHTEKTQ